MPISRWNLVNFYHLAHKRWPLQTTWNPLISIVNGPFITHGFPKSLPVHLSGRRRLFRIPINLGQPKPLFACQRQSKTMERVTLLAVLLALSIRPNLPLNTPKSGRFCLSIGHQKSRFGDCIAHRQRTNKHVHMYHRSPQPNPTLDSYRKIDKKIKVCILNGWSKEAQMQPILPLYRVSKKSIWRLHCAQL